MIAGWSPEALAAIGAAAELRIAVRRTDGTLRDAVPIWVVTTDGAVLVRTWYRRDTGWYGRALASGRAHVSVPGAEADVTVTDVGERDRDAVDTAYRRKYGSGGSTERMTGSDAAATTLRLDPEPTTTA